MPSRRIAVVVILSVAWWAVSPLWAQVVEREPREKAWPQFGYGFFPGFMVRGKQIDVDGMLLQYVTQCRWYPDYLELGVTLDQARAIDSQMNERKILLAPVVMKLVEAESRGDEQAAASARQQLLVTGSIVCETDSDMFREVVLKTFDAHQSETIKSMCVNLVMGQVRLSFLIPENRDALFGNRLPWEEMVELRESLAEIERDLDRATMDLRRKAWDKVMQKLPTEVVEQIEEQLGFGGLKKPESK